MSTNSLETAYSNGDVIDASHINELTLALLESFVGRNSSGVPTSGKSLGTLALPWGNIFANGIVLNGNALDLSNITSKSNRIVSGKTRALSSQPDFLRPNGAALSFQILGASTNLLLSINNIATTIAADLTKTGLTAAPATNNTVQVNDTTMVNDKFTEEIIVDNMGSEITALVGQYAAFKKGNEIMLAYVDSTIKLTNVMRGYFFDNAGAPIVRENLSNNDFLTLLKLAWVFIEDNATTVDVTYKTPVISYTAPASPVTGDYWYDISNNVWKRYSGTSFEIINRMLIGVVASDTTNTIAARSFDFYKSFSSSNNVELEIFSTEIIRAKNATARVSVYGSNVEIDNTLLNWNITTDLESPLTEASSTDYYLYLSDKGQRIISNEKPYNRKDLKGYYHPYHTWRCLGEFFNNSSSNIVYACEFAYNTESKKDYSAILSDTRTAGTSGATSSAGTNTRVINTVNDPDKILISVVSNQILLPKGRYFIDVDTLQYKGEQGKLLVTDVATSNRLVIGVGTYNRDAINNMASAALKGEFTIKETKLIEIQHYVSTGSAQGFGVPAGAFEENYLTAIIKKIGLA